MPFLVVQVRRRGFLSIGLVLAFGFEFRSPEVEKQAVLDAGCGQVIHQLDFIGKNQALVTSPIADICTRCSRFVRIAIRPPFHDGRPSARRRHSRALLASGR